VSKKPASVGSAGARFQAGILSKFPKNVLYSPYTRCLTIAFALMIGGISGLAPGTKKFCAHVAKLVH
jgi:hypothetical protein